MEKKSTHSTVERLEALVRRARARYQRRTGTLRNEALVIYMCLEAQLNIARWHAAGGIGRPRARRQAGPKREKEKTK